jgi:hypothetical protein
MNHTHKNESPVSAGQFVKTLSKDRLNCATDTQHSKAEITLIARLVVAKHAVHKLATGGYLVCKYGYTHHASDFAALQCFARRLGVCHD